MNIWNYLAGGAVLGVIAGCWNKIKEWLWRFFSLFIQRVEIDSEWAHNALVGYLIANYRRSRIYDHVYGACREYYCDGRYGLVPYEVFGLRSVVFWNGWWPFVFHNAVEQKAQSSRGNREGTDGGKQKEPLVDLWPAPEQQCG